LKYGFWLIKSSRSPSKWMIRIPIKRGKYRKFIRYPILPPELIIAIRETTQVVMIIELKIPTPPSLGISPV
jgi:hypothetical protein